MDVIIDAYNMIFKVPELGGNTKKNDIEDLRERFLLLMKQYKAERNHKLIVVFDGKGYGSSNMTEDSGVDILFSRPGLDADEEIKRLVSGSKHPRQIIVVTSDNDIRHLVKKYGSKVKEPLKFYKEVVDKITHQSLPESKIKNKNKNKDMVDEREPISKYIGPSKAESQYWFKVFSEKIGNLSDD